MGGGYSYRFIGYIGGRGIGYRGFNVRGFRYVVFIVFKVCKIYRK